MYQRRTKNGIGRLKKTVLGTTAKTQRVETTKVDSAIDKEVRFFFIFLFYVFVKIIMFCKETDFFLFTAQFCGKERVKELFLVFRMRVLRPQNL